MTSYRLLCLQQDRSYLHESIEASSDEDALRILGALYPLLNCELWRDDVRLAVFRRKAG